MNAVPFNRPNCVSVIPMSCFSGPTSSEMMKRSSTDIQNMNESTAVAYQATARAGYGVSASGATVERGFLTRESWYAPIEFFSAPRLSARAKSRAR